MTHEAFIEKAKELTLDFTNKQLVSKGGVPVTEAAIYVVWSCKTLQNSKAMLSSTVSDGMYYEATLNGDSKEIYFDAYRKISNVAHSVIGG